MIEKDSIALWQQKRREEPRGDTSPITLTRTFLPDQNPADSPFRFVKAVIPFQGHTYHFLSGAKLFLLGLKTRDYCMMNLGF